MSSNPGLRRVTVRFAEAAHQMVEDAATREGVPFAQYLREAALMRVTWEIGLLRGASTFENTAEDWLAVVRELRETMAVDPPNGNGDQS